MDGVTYPDTLIGNAGDDVLIMGDGDIAKGGSGADTHKISLGANLSVLIRGFSLSNDQVVLTLPSGFAITGAKYQRVEVDGDGKNNDMKLVLKGSNETNETTASLVFEDRYGALRKDAGLLGADFADDGEAAVPDSFDDFVADHDWIAFG